MIVRPKRIYRKRIPYGMQNFEDVIKEDCYYVDKTPFIEQIEESNKYFFYIRPRRFGKTLTLSMLENYYDINKKDKFDEIFGKLYIGQNPTPEHNTYLIIHLNFAEVAADQLAENSLHHSSFPERNLYHSASVCAWRNHERKLWFVLEPDRWCEFTVVPDN